MAYSTATSVPSSLLTGKENELVFTLVGYRRQSKATAVVQMFNAISPDPTQWTKFRTGVVCFVKDNINKSYYIRLFDLQVSDPVLVLALEFITVCPPTE